MKWASEGLFVKFLDFEAGPAVDQGQRAVERRSGLRLCLSRGARD
jgi:hypothetical protein